MSEFQNRGFDFWISPNFFPLQQCHEIFYPSTNFTCFNLLKIYNLQNNSMLPTFKRNKDSLPCLNDSFLRPQRKWAANVDRRPPVEKDDRPLRLLLRRQPEGRPQPRRPGSTGVSSAGGLGIGWPVPAAAVPALARCFVGCCETFPPFPWTGKEVMK